MAEHAHHAKGKHAVSCAIVTVSDTRTPETDKSGQIIRERLEQVGHRIVGYRIAVRLDTMRIGLRRRDAEDVWILLDPQ